VLVFIILSLAHSFTTPETRSYATWWILIFKSWHIRKVV